MTNKSKEITYCFYRLYFSGHVYCIQLWFCLVVFLRTCVLHTALVLFGCISPDMCIAYSFGFAWLYFSGHVYCIHFGFVWLYFSGHVYCIHFGFVWLYFSRHVYCIHFGFVWMYFSGHVYCIQLWFCLVVFLRTCVLHALWFCLVVFLRTCVLHTLWFCLVVLLRTCVLHTALVLFGCIYPDMCIAYSFGFVRLHFSGHVYAYTLVLSSLVVFISRTASVTGELQSQVPVT